MAKPVLKNVLILELGGSHIECVHTLLHLLHLRGARVHIACNQQLVSSIIEKDKLTGLLTLPNEILKRQQFAVFFAIRRYINTQGIGTVIINTTELTIVRDMLWFLPKLNYVGLVHNAIKLEKSFTLTRLIARRVKKIFVLGNYLLQHVKPAPVFKVAPLFPVYFPTPVAVEIKKMPNEFWIIVPGLATNARRDYKGLLEALSKQENLPANVKFIFLGQYQLNDIVTEETKASACWKSHIVLFNEFVDYNTFHSYMQQGNCVLPLLHTHENDFYGNHRISGSFNLGLGYQLPFLLPDAYKQNTDLQPYSLYYHSMNELLQLIGLLAGNNSSRLTAISNMYKTSPYNHIEAMAGEVCNFIFS